MRLQVFVHKCFTIVVILVAPIIFFPVGGIADDFSEYVSFNARLRLRGSSLVNFDVARETDDKASNFTSRLRLGMDFQFNEYLGGRIQIQGFQLWNDLAWDFSEKQNFDLTEGYLDLTGIWNEMVDIRVGRQIITKGDEIIFGDQDWYSLGRTHNAASIMIRPTPYQDWNLLYINIRKQSYAQYQTTEWRGDLFGLYDKFVIESSVNVEPYYIFQRYDASTIAGWFPQTPQQTGNLTLHTVGALVKFRPLEMLALGFEGNIQKGVYGPAKIESFMVHTLLGMETGLPFVEAASIAYDIYSGDKDKNDNIISTYQPIFPSSYKHVGLIGWYGMKNLTAIKGSLTGTIIDRLKFQVDGYSFQLHQLSDYTYWVNNEKNVPSVGATSKDLGWSADLILAFQLMNNINITATASIYRPGDFCREVLSPLGLTTDNITYLTVGCEATL